MLKTIKIADIKIGKRHRKDMGDLTSLADSIRHDGLLQPIGVTDKFRLVFGERRLRATTGHPQEEDDLARIVDVSSIVSGEYAENEIRKDFTPSERVAIAKAIENKVGNRQGQRTDKPVGKIPQVLPGKRTREIAAEKAGFGNDKTYRQAAKVVKNGTPKLIQAMDDGRVSISAASILTDADPDEQEAIVELDEKAILQAAKEIRARHAEKRAKHQAATTVKPQSRTKKQRLKATRLIHGDCRQEMKKLRANSIDLILTDPPYPEIDREYGKLTEAEWHELMNAVVTEGRRVLKPTGSMVVILQPNFEKIGQDAGLAVGVHGVGGPRVELDPRCVLVESRLLAIAKFKPQIRPDAAVHENVRVAGTSRTATAIRTTSSGFPRTTTSPNPNRTPLFVSLRPVSIIVAPESLTPSRNVEDRHRSICCLWQQVAGRRQTTRTQLRLLMMLRHGG